MNRVLDRLWIGASVDFSLPLRELGFAGVVDLRDNAVPAPASVVVHALTNRDGDPWSAPQVVAALDFIADKILDGAVLVACAAGMSRSASMVVAYLVRCGWDPSLALSHLRAVRPVIAPVPAMLALALRAARGREV